MAYHFPLMPRMYMAVAQEDRHPIVEILQQTPEIPTAASGRSSCSNHDELTLEMVTEPGAGLHVPAPTPPIRAVGINVGIRRRLAPLMDNDSRQASN
jgi:maltose alpha-D-glucosyltransferase/alpha-amylase